MTRKLSAGVVALVVALALVTGCSGTTGSTPPAPSSTASPGSPGGPGSPPPGGGAAQTETSGTAATTFNTNISTQGWHYESTTADENAIRVEGRASVSLFSMTVHKTGDSSNTGNSDFYGQNAGILVRDSGQLNLGDSTVRTDAVGANGVFVYNTGSAATLKDVIILTASNNSGGIDVAGGGTITASHLEITTQGESSAAIRSDRGGGTMNVTQGNYVTNGVGSPAVYSTADITVSDATLTANSSEAVVIEGANQVRLNNDTVTGNMTSSNGGAADNLHAVMIYQSMSGDASNGGGMFAMFGGELTSRSGDTFYVTNTTATISLNSVAITNSPSGNLLTVAGNDGSRGWGAAGSNGGNCTLETLGETMAGTITVDSISSLTFNLIGGSAFTGTINPAGAAGTVTMKVASGSKWTLTADAYVTSFNGTKASVKANGHHLYVNGKVFV